MIKLIKRIFNRLFGKPPSVDFGRAKIEISTDSGLTWHDVGITTSGYKFTGKDF